MDRLDTRWSGAEIFLASVLDREDTSMVMFFLISTVSFTFSSSNDFLYSSVGLFDCVQPQQWRRRFVGTELFVQVFVSTHDVCDVFAGVGSVVGTELFVEVAVVFSIDDADVSAGTGTVVGTELVVEVFVRLHNEADVFLGSGSVVPVSQSTALASVYIGLVPLHPTIHLRIS